MSQLFQCRGLNSTTNFRGGLGGRSPPSTRSWGIPRCIIHSNAICVVGARVSRSIGFTNRYWRIYVYVLLRVFLGQLD